GDRYCTQPGLSRSGNISVQFGLDEALNSLAAITGVVQDATGAVIPRAEIKLLETMTGKVQTLTTGANGRFRLAALAPGRYQIEGSLAGFQSAVMPFSLRERNQALFTVTLEVGSVSQMVMVTGEAALVQRAEVPRSLRNETMVRELPLNGRSFDDL